MSCIEVFNEYNTTQFEKLDDYRDPFPEVRICGCVAVNVQYDESSDVICELSGAKVAEAELVERAGFQYYERDGYISSPILSSECPANFTQVNGTSSCYHLSDFATNWTESRAWCQRSGADLVVFESAEEYQAVRAVFEVPKAWIGLRDTVGNSSWRWVRTEETPAFTNWNIGEPNFLNERCVEMIIQGTWNNLAYKNIDQYKETRPLLYCYKLKLINLTMPYWKLH
ncbi:perlucin-like protein [Lingula anatina]|uniref:Perlucin-like protein n=1 Tax=Lingula anatina TaxID=7574 RepID=A0A1S3ICZ8_LINAN|nr:perlucin-like protein [Lingula anatina]|eukprot:XP_013396107.1 perlucin-like protein [Lingula anatina]